MREGDLGDLYTEWSRKCCLLCVLPRLFQLTTSFHLRPRPLDTLSTFETASSTSTTSAPARYAVRQVLDQEHQKYLIRQRTDARQARFTAGNPLDDNNVTLPLAGTNYPFFNDNNKENLDSNNFSNKRGLDNDASKPPGVKRDFFGRVIANEANSATGGKDGKANGRRKGYGAKREERVWVSFHEGFSNAVRKSIGLEELIRGLS